MGGATVLKEFWKDFNAGIGVCADKIAEARIKSWESAEYQILELEPESFLPKFFPWN